MREKIVRVYGLVAGPLDSLNTCARDFERWRSLRDTDLEKAMVGTMVNDFQIGILNGLSDLQRELGRSTSEILRFCSLKRPVYSHSPCGSNFLPRCLIGFGVQYGLATRAVLAPATPRAPAPGHSLPLLFVPGKPWYRSCAFCDRYRWR